MSLLTSFTRGGGDSQLPYVQTPLWGVGSTPAAWPVAALAVYWRFRLAAPVRINKAKIYVGTAAGNVDIGWGILVPSTAGFTRQAATGAVAAAGTNAIQSLDLADLWMPAGTDLVVGMGATSTSLTLLRSTQVAAATAFGQGYSKTASATIPATDTLTAGTNGAFIPWIWLGYE